MEEFYQQFKDNLENRPEPEFDPAAWTDLERRMERAAAGAGMVFNWWWAAVPLLLLLLGSNFFLYRQLSHNNRQINALLLQKDTVIQRQVILQIDTIYQTRTVREPAAPEVANVFSNASIPNFLDQTYAYRALYRSDFHTPGSGLYPTSPATLGELRRQIGAAAFSTAPVPGEATPIGLSPVDAAQNTKKGFSFAQLPSSAGKPLSYNNDWSIEEQPMAMTDYERKKRIYLGQYLAPTGVEAGAFIGSEALTKIKVNGFSLGLTGNVFFGDRLQLWVEAGRTQFQIKLEETNRIFGLNDEINSPLDDFVLNSIEASPSYWQGAAGLQYRLNPQGILQPFFGAGFSLLHLEPFQAEYKFYNAATEQELELYESVREEGSNSYFTSQLGLRYQSHKRLALQLNGQYRHAFEQNNNLGIGSSVAVRLGLFYRL